VHIVDDDGKGRADASDVGRAQSREPEARVEVDRIDDAAEAEARIRRAAIKDYRQPKRAGA